MTHYHAHLMTLLATLSLLGQQTRAYHWNVKGAFFGQLHALFGEQYDCIDEEIDLVAERMRALLLVPPTTYEQYLESSLITHDTTEKTYEEMLHALLTSHEILIDFLIGVATECEMYDSETADFVRQITITHQKMAWILRSHLES